MCLDFWTKLTWYTKIVLFLLWISCPFIYWLNIFNLLALLIFLLISWWIPSPLIFNFRLFIRIKIRMLISWWVSAPLINTIWMINNLCILLISWRISTPLHNRFTSNLRFTESHIWIMRYDCIPVTIILIFNFLFWSYFHLSKSLISCILFLLF